MVVGHNVEGTIASVVQRLPSDLDLIVVDDGSTDGTLQQIEGCGVVVQHSENLGYGAAQKSGYRKALERGAILSRCAPPVPVMPSVSDHGSLFPHRRC